MEREGNDCIEGAKFLPDDGPSVLNSNMFLDHVGEVTLTFNSDRLSWKLIESLDNDNSTCLGIKSISKAATEIKLSDIYAIEVINHGLVHISSVPRTTRSSLRADLEMYRFTVHGVLRSKTQPSPWILTTYTFGHKDLQTCQTWVNGLKAYLNFEPGRPRNLMVFINPRSGKGNGCKTWEGVAPIFSRAKVKTKVIVTERAGQANDVMSSISNKELSSYDGVVVVGGDGFFNEILNGFLSPRHKAPNPPMPSDFNHSVKDNDGSMVHDESETIEETHNQTDAPLLPSQQTTSTISNSNSADEDPDFPIPNERFRFGIIPAGSTDAIVICTTGSRDPITSALHIVLGKRVHLDIAQVVRWKTTPRSDVEPCVRYAASFAGYGFYGDVITESEKYRWMGPKRYDYAGTMVFLRHRYSLKRASCIICRFHELNQRMFYCDYAYSEHETPRISSRPIGGRKTRAQIEHHHKTFVISDHQVKTNSQHLGHTDSPNENYLGELPFRSYEAEVAYLEIESNENNSNPKTNHQGSLLGAFRSPSRSERSVCRVGCKICNVTSNQTSTGVPCSTPYLCPEGRWVKSKGRFLSVGAAVISCRNDKAPDGLVAEAHLADGFLHLILIRDCPHAAYLWHLTQLTRRGGNPLDFKFVEHHKTPAFTFTSLGNESVWNLDGEIFRAHRLSAQVFRGLVCLFASGPEV